MTHQQKFLLEIGRIKDLEIFFGIARVLKVKIADENKEPRSFADVFENVMNNYAAAPRKRRRELLKILEAANASSPKDS